MPAVPALSTSTACFSAHARCNLGFGIQGKETVDDWPGRKFACFVSLCIADHLRRNKNQNNCSSQRGGLLEPKRPETCSHPAKSWWLGDNWDWTVDRWFSTAFSFVLWCGDSLAWFSCLYICLFCVCMIWPSKKEKMKKGKKEKVYDGSRGSMPSFALEEPRWWWWWYEWVDGWFHHPHPSSVCSSVLGRLVT